MAHLFISYSKKDIDFARRLKRLLEAEGFAVWMDETKLVPSEQWWPTIERSIDTCSAFIVIMSPNSQGSRWVEREILRAEDPEVNKPIFPVLLAGRAWSRLADVQYADMTAGMRATLPDLLCEGLRRVVPAASAASAPPPLPGDPISGSLPVRERPSSSDKYKERLNVATAAAPRRLVAGGLVALAVLALIVVLVVVLNNPGSGGLQSAATGTETTPAALVASNTPTTAPTQTHTPTATDSPLPEGEAEGGVRATLIPAGTSNDAWTPVYETFNSVEMALVPAGCFRMGNDPDAYDAGNQGVDDGGEQCFEQPFWIGRYEVTNAQYAACVAAGACREPGACSQYSSAPDEPVICVDWFQAGEYAAWLNALTPRPPLPQGEGEWRLPTEREWEYAARGPEGRFYPWGNDFDRTLLNFCDENCTYDWRDADYDDGYPYTSPVGTYSPGGDSWVGAADLAGNVWEWTGTLYDDYPYDAGDGREVLADASSPWVLRGGGFLYRPEDARAAVRLRHGSDGNQGFGFRVVCGAVPTS